MLPGSSIGVGMGSGKVQLRPDRAGRMAPITAPITLRFDQVNGTEVSERYEHARSAVERTNCQIVLLADEGRHAQEIAWLVRRGPDQVRKVLIRPTTDQPCDLLSVASFVGQQHDLAIRPLHRTAGVLVAFGDLGPRHLVQAQPYRGGHRQHSPGPYRAGVALYRNPCLPR